VTAGQPRAAHDPLAYGGSGDPSGAARIRTAALSAGSGDRDGDDLVAMPALRLDAALVHMNRADAAGNGQYLGPDPYFDDLFCLAAERAYVSCERIVPDLLHEGPPQSLLLNRAMVHGVTETSNGAHFTSCVPDYGRDEEFQRQYAAAAPIRMPGSGSVPTTWTATRPRTSRRSSDERTAWGRDPGRGLRGGLRRGLAGGRRHPGSPMGVIPRSVLGSPATRSRPTCC